MPRILTLRESSVTGDVKRAWTPFFVDGRGESAAFWSLRLPRFSRSFAGGACEAFVAWRTRAEPFRTHQDLHRDDNSSDAVGRRVLLVEAIRLQRRHETTMPE